MRNSALPFVILISLMWGSGYVFLKIAEAGLPPFWLAALRAGLAIPVLLLVWTFWTSERFADFRWRDALVIGTTNGWLPNALAALAIARLPAAEAGMLHALTPVFTGLLAATLLADERLTRGIILGLILGFLGVALIAMTGEVGSGDWIGRLCMVGVAFSFAAGSVYARAIKTSTPALLAAMQFTVATVVALAISFALGETQALPPEPTQLAAMVALSIFSTAAPAVLFLILIARHQAVRVGGVSYLQPVWAILLGALLLGETITTLQLLGLGLVLYGVWCVTKG